MKAHIINRHEDKKLEIVNKLICEFSDAARINGDISVQELVNKYTNVFKSSKNSLILNEESEAYMRAENAEVFHQPINFTGFTINLIFNVEKIFDRLNSENTETKTFKVSQLKKEGILFSQDPWGHIGSFKDIPPIIVPFPYVGLAKYLVVNGNKRINRLSASHNDMSFDLVLCNWQIAKESIVGEFQQHYYSFLLEFDKVNHFE